MSERSAREPRGGLTAVVDVGKTHRRLLVLDADGCVQAESQGRNTTVRSYLGYDALDAAGCGDWLSQELVALGDLRRHLRRVVVTTHGAAIAAVAPHGLAIPVPDYEWDGFDERAPDWLQHLDPFDASLSPVLPRGLNLGVQLDWLDRHVPGFDRTGALMPYAQYWGWWLTGQMASEVSSLGCHSLLWNPVERRYSDWANRRGWAARFAPMRKAWDVLGSVRTELCEKLGLPRNVSVHVGAHDSNACLARYVRHWPRMTLVSSGTWVVVMAPGGSPQPLRPTLDQLGNVSVRGDCVPTARFMGGREMEVLCAGASPSLANLDTLQALLARRLQILPGFSDQGGPFTDRAGRIEVDGRTVPAERWERAFSDAERASAASWYIGLMTARTIDAIGGLGPIVLEGPVGANPICTATLAAVMEGRDVMYTRDELEGTARGAWYLSRWLDPIAEPPLQVVALPSAELLSQLRQCAQRWTQALSSQSPSQMAAS